MSTPVTGGMGFVGSNIVRSLARRGHQAVCFDYTNDSTTLCPPKRCTFGRITLLGLTYVPMIRFRKH